MTEVQWLSNADPIEMVEFLRGNPTSEDTVTWWNNRWQLDEACTGRERKFRLFACACCRRIWDYIPEACNRDVVAAVEHFLDRRVTGPALEAALVASSAVEWPEDGSGRRPEPGYWAVKYLGRGFYKMTAGASALIVASTVMFMADAEYGREARDVFGGCYYAAAGNFLSPFRWPSPVPPAVEAERATQAALLRRVFGNPFSAMPHVDPSLLKWNGGTVRHLAEVAYEERELPSGHLCSAKLAILADALEDAGCTDADLLSHLRCPGPHVRGCFVLDLLLGKS